MSATPTTRQLVVCSLGEEEYALPIAQVREIVRASEPRSVASDVPWMRGVISLRGMLVPVYDLAARLGLPGGDAGTKIVIVETETGPVGMLVDHVVEVLTVAAAQVEEVPTPGVDGRPASIVKLGERLVLLLDASDLLIPAPAPAPADAAAHIAV